MKYYSKKQWTHKLTVMVLLAMALGGTAVQAMPSGGDIRSGQGSISQDGKNMTVLQNSDRMAIDWTKFDIAKDETVRYAQPDRNAISLNRVTGGQQSVIAGNLNANGNVVLVNPNGVVFTKNSSVDVGGLVASTARLNDEAMKNFGNGKDSLGLSLDKDSTAAVINEGQIKAQGGLVALHAANVENKGTIINEGGTLAMAAAKNLTLSAADDDKLNFTVDGDLAKAQALNSGSLKANGGYVVMTAKSAGDVLSTVVNNSGTIEAKTLRKNEKGQILLDGGDNGQVEVSGTLDASGTEAGQDAGNIKVIGQKTIVHDNTNLLAKGDNNGGKIETSGDVLNLGDNLNIDAKGVNGKAGEWLLDPLDVIIADKNNDPTGTDSYSNAEKKTAGDSDFTNGSASIDYNDPEATTANAASVNSAVTWIYTETVENMLNNGTNVTIQAAATNGSANIIVKNDIDKTAGDDATFTLDAMRNITVDGNITSKVGKLKVVLNADSDGDKIGAVIINKDIKTNGGDFISASGGTVKYTSDKNNTKGYGKGTLTGSADPVGHSVGTYFGHVDESGTADGEKDDRLIQTNGGKITLNGEVAIGLNGGTLTLDSSNASGIKGDITVTGIINSGNSYGAYVYGTTTWDELTAEKVNEYLTSDFVPAYRYQGVNYVKNSDGSYKTTTDKADFSKGEPHYIFDKETNTQNLRWLGDGSSTAVSLDKGQGYSSVIITEGKMSTKEYLQYVAVSDPTGFLSRYMTSNPTFTVGSTSYTLTVSSVKVNGVDNNALGYNTGGKFTALTKAQIQNLADSALTLAKNSTDKTTMSNGKTAYTNLTNDIKQLIASNWFVSENLAKYNPKTKTYNEGKSAVGDSYLATITTVLENSLTTPNGQQYLWVGGRGSGVLNKKGSTNNDKLYPYSYWGMPDDPTYQDGMYWVTGPEGEANNDKGTQFYSNAGSDWGTVSLSSDGKTYTYNQGSNVYGFVNWDTWPDKAKATDGKRVDVTRSQPDNSSPFLSVGYGTHGKWDDGAMGGATTVGFVKETNLANSSLNIKAGSGDVKLQGDIGKAKALDTVNIESKGAVTVGTDNNNVTDYYHGTIYADHGIYISGGTVNVGGEIHSGGTNVEATKMTDSAFSDYLDNVTIRSSGNLTVHGIEVNTSTDSDGKTTSRTDGEGGKIKLTSTGTEGVITLGDGVDYNGKNTNGGVLKAASTANDSVVIDAQGAESKFKNETSSTKAIDTKGKWKIYSASPEQNTFGKNLNSVTDDSVTDAQWTSNSTKFTAADSDENKYIFQTTPTITLYVEDHEKTYGDDITKELQSYLKSREEFTGLDGKLHNVNEFTDAFTEKTYDNYISGAEKVTVTSVGKDGADGAVGTATRTGGTHAATEKSGADGKNAVYDLNVNLNGATAKKGYVLKNENATLEILKRKASITGKGTQTYGDTDGTIKKWQQDTQTNIANGSKVTYDTSVKPGSAYTDNQKGRNTADSGTYENSVSFDNLKITDAKENEVNIADNYDLTTTGTIDVAKAKLTVNTDGKTTTYGTVDEDYKSSLDKTTQALNGDKEADLLKELGLTYTLDPKDSAYIDSDGDGKYDRTNHVKYTSDGKDYDSYTLDVANTNTLKNYEVTVNDSTVTLERAKATVDTDKVTTDYGKVNTSYTSHFNTAVNGDNGDELLKQLDLSYSTDAYKDAGHTNNVKEGGYDLKVQANGFLTYDDYDVTVNPSNVTLNKVNLKVNPEDIKRIYGQAKEVQEAAKTAYNLSGFANGDTKDTVDATNKDGKTIDQLVKVTNNVSKALKDDGTHTQNASTDGYDMVTTASGDLTNYNIVVGEQKKVYLDKAALIVDTTGNTRTYGDVSNVASDVANAASFHLSGSTDETVNGDTEADILKELGLSTSSDAQVKDDAGKVVKTGNANTDPGYDIKATFNKNLTNYTVSEGTVGKEKIEKAALVVDTTGHTRTYGDVSNVASDVANAASFHLSGSTDKTVNGDTEADILKELGLSTSSDAQVKDDAGKVVKTGNANTDPGYDIKATFNKNLTNYTVSEGTVGKEKIEKAALVVDTTGNTRTYGDVSNVASDVANAASFHLSGSTDKTVNGDTEADILKELGLSTSSDAQVKDDAGKVVKTGNANTDPGYDIKATFNKNL
ncbi:filamentous hemagglutinin N-terminal domain-containing protein, partial [Megasphaera sp.]|uniref:two-partner secretion domain-containing protein n=1 Tax=Megasphaera sp. TaxID=2023260 RepID=UPI003AAB2128